MDETPDPVFTIVGTVADRPATITWTPDGGFVDPFGRTRKLIATKTQLCSTPTGPCWTAAAEPEIVAWMTAKNALDTIESWDHGGDRLQAELVALSAVPDGATP